MRGGGGSVVLCGALGALLGLAGCAHGVAIATTSLADIDRVRLSPGAQEGLRLAPQEYQHAEQERALAHKSDADGDGTSASLHVERAMASYQRAFALARLAKAKDDLAAATAELQIEVVQEQHLSASRADVEREADELDKRLKVAKEALALVPSGPADPAREAARLVAARSLVAQGRLLCGAARLLAPKFAGLEEGEKDAADLDAALARAPHPAPIDNAARVRAACLALLTRARREALATAQGGQAADADALLEELAAAGSWDPSRDERGVVVTLRDAFKGAALQPEAQKKLEDLGRVAAAHAGFAVQLVLHDVTEPNAREATLDAQRADAAVSALLAGGGDKARVKGLGMGARVPVVDPADARHRGRNERVEVVFVAPD